MNITKCHFFLHPKRFVSIVLTKVLLLLFTLTSAIFAQIGHLEDTERFCTFAMQFNSTRVDSH